MLSLKALQQIDGYTFDEGVAVLVMCRAPKGVIAHISRTHNRAYLHAEIHKQLRMPGVAQRLKAQMPADDTAPAVAKTEVATENTPEIATPEREVSVKAVRTIRPTRYEDMPTDYARELWLKKQDKYREMQQHHLKMRQVPEGDKYNDDRARERAAVMKLDAEIEKLWQQIDEEVAKNA